MEMRLFFIAGIMWAINDAAYSVAVMPTYSPEIQDGSTTGASPTLQTFLIPYETDIPSVELVGIRSMPHYTYFTTIDETKGVLPNDQGFGERLKTSNELKTNYPNSNHSFDILTSKTDKPRDNPYDSIQFMKLAKTLKTVKPDYSIDENVGQFRETKAAPLSDVRNVSEEIYRKLSGDYRERQAEESVLPEILRSYDENESINRTVSAEEAGMGKEELQSPVNEPVDVLPSGTFARPIVVPDEPYDENFRENNHENSVRGSNERISAAETRNREGLTSSSIVLNPLQVGIALGLAKQNSTANDESNEIDKNIDAVPSVDHGKDNDFVADQPKTRIEEPVTSTVEIQKSIELYHHAPIQEIHYPVEYTGHIPSQNYDEGSRYNIIQNPANSRKNKKEHEIIPSQSLNLKDQRPPIPISWNNGMAEESEANIVAQRAVYLPTINDHQAHVTVSDYDDRKYLTQLPAGSESIPNEEPVLTPSESIAINHAERSLSPNTAQLAVYQLTNFQLLPKNPWPTKVQENRNIPQQYVQPYIVEYRKSVQQPYLHQLPENPPVVYTTLKLKPPESISQVTVPENNSPFQRPLNEDVIRKIPIHATENEQPYLTNQNAVRQEIIPQEYSASVRAPVNPQLSQKQLPHSPIVPYTIQRFVVEPQVRPILQPHILKPLDLGSTSNEQVIRYRSRVTQRPTGAGKYNSLTNVGARPAQADAFYNNVAKAPEENFYHIVAIPPRPTQQSEQRQNLSVLQYLENRPPYLEEKENMDIKKDQPKNKLPEMQISANLEPPRKFGNRVRFFVQPQLYGQIILDSTSRKRQALYRNVNRSAKEIKEGRNSIAVSNFRQSKMEYGFKPPMIPSVQYDEETAARVKN